MIEGNVVPVHPTQVHIEISSKCNLACGFCPVHRVTRGTQLSRDEIDDVIRQAAEFKPEYVDFVNYNEPLLHKDFWHHADHVARLLGFGKMGMVSNGTVMSRDIAQRIIDLHPKQVVFSVDAFTAATYAKVRPRWTSNGPIEDLFLRDLIYANINLYLDCIRESGTHMWPVIEMVVCDHNAHEVDLTRDYWKARLNNQFLVINCTGRGGERAFTEPNDNPCRVILDGLWVLSDGVVVACCEDWNAMSPVGDVRAETLEQIWNGARIREFRERHFSGRKSEIPACAGCKTSLDCGDHYKFPEKTNAPVLVDLRSRGVSV